MTNKPAEEIKLSEEAERKRKIIVIQNILHYFGLCDINKGIELMLYATITPLIKSEYTIDKYSENGEIRSIKMGKLRISCSPLVIGNKKVADMVKIEDNEKIMECFINENKIHGHASKKRSKYGDEYFYEALFDENGLITESNYEIGIGNIESNYSRTRNLYIGMQRIYEREGIIAIEKIMESPIGLQEDNPNRRFLLNSKETNHEYKSLSEGLIPYIPILIDKIPADEEYRDFFKELYAKAEKKITNPNTRTK